MELAQNKKYSDAERAILKALSKKGDNPMISVYTTDKPKAHAVFKISSEDGAIEPDDALEELADYINGQNEFHEFFKIRVKKNPKDSGTEIRIKGGKKSKKLGDNNNKNSDPFKGSNMTMFSMLLQQMDKTNTTKEEFKDFQNKMMFKMLESKYEGKNYSIKKKLKKQKKKAKAKEQGKLLNKVLNSEVVKNTLPILVSKVVGTPTASKVIPIQRPIETRANIAGVPNNVQPVKKAVPKQEIPNQEIEEEEEELDDLSEDEIHALEGLETLKQAGIAKPGLRMWAMTRVLVMHGDNPMAKALISLIDQEQAAIEAEL